MKSSGRMIMALLLLLCISTAAGSAEPWWNDKWGFRLPVTVDPGIHDRFDYLLRQEVSIRELLVDRKMWEKFDPNSIRLLERVEGEEREVPSLFIKGDDYATTGRGTLCWMLPGKTASLTDREFYIYFDMSAAGIKAAEYPSLTETSVKRADNLLTNSGFEEGEGRSLPGWTITGSPTAGSAGSAEDQFYKGKKSLKISQPVGVAASYHYLYGGWRPELKVTPGKTYRLSGWIKSAGKGTQCLSLSFMGEEWKSLPPAPRSYIIISAVDGHDWKEVSGLLTAPPGTVYASVRAYLFNAQGLDAWFDDISLREVELLQPPVVKLGKLQKRK